MKNNNKKQELLDVLKTISTSITKNHTDLIVDKAMEIEEIETTYYHGEIDDLETDPLDFINLHVIKEIAEYLIKNYDHSKHNYPSNYKRKQSMLK
jgi:hypothetical protein